LAATIETGARVIAMKGAWFTGLPTRRWTWTEILDQLKFEGFVKKCAERRKGGLAAVRLVPL